MSAEARINIEVNAEDVTRSIEKFQGAIDILGGSVETVVGSLALFGVENKFIENLEQGALGAIALADGTKRIADGLKDFVGETKLATTAQAIFNAVQNANPIFLIITALAAATGAAILFTKAIADSAQEQALANTTAIELNATLTSNAAAADELGLSMQDVADIAALARGEAESQLEILNSSEETLKRQGLTEEEIEDLKINQLRTIVEASKTEANARREAIKGDVARTKTYFEVTKAIITFLTAPITLILGSIDALTLGLNKLGLLSDEYVTNLAEGFTGGLAGLIFNVDEVEAEGQAAVAEAEKQARDAQNAIDGIINARTKRRQDAAKKAREAEEKAAEKARQDALKKAEEEQARLSELYKQQQDDLTQRIIDAEAKLDADLITFQDNQEGKALAYAEYERVIAEVEAEGLKRAQDNATAKKAIDDKAAEDAKKNADEAVKIQREKNKAIEEAEQELYDAQVGFANASLAALSEIAGENEQIQNAIFAVEKAVAIGDIITRLQAEKAANAAYGATLGPGIGDAYRITKNKAANIRAAASIATIVAATISKFKNGGSAGLGGEEGGGGGGLVAGFALGSSVQQQSNLQTPTGVAGGPIQAYVLAGDVSNGLEAEQRINSRRKL
jgi:colicin import membrane protein